MVIFMLSTSSYFLFPVSYHLFVNRFSCYAINMKMTNFISKGSVQVEAKIDSTFNSHHNASQEVENKLLQMNVVLQRLQSPLQCTIW